MKIGLGTVQFGLDYGVTNPSGMVPRAECASILEAASAGGIRILDTAAAYGESESVLGELLPACGYPFEIVTKTVPLLTEEVGGREVNAFREGIARSLFRLKKDCLDTLLVHHAEDLLIPGGERLYEELNRALDDGTVKRIGFSAYDARQVESILGKYKFSVVQLPVSVFDQRLIESGTLRALEDQGIEVHARSVFLQGLLLQGAGTPERFSRWSGLMSRYHQFLATTGFTPLAAALGFVASLSEVGTVLLGVTSRRELTQCLAVYTEDMRVDFGEFSVKDIDLIDPRRWGA
jgi:aryl-alcohol dehydrogenase-like predicted oxidoreductase